MSAYLNSGQAGHCTGSAVTRDGRDTQQTDSAGSAVSGGAGGPAGDGMPVRKPVGAAVYLAGPINGQTDAQCKVWREQAAARLEAAGLTALSPLARDYRGVEAQHVTEIVEGDLADLATCDAVLVDAWRPSWGTAMEIREAHRLGKRVFAFAGRTRPLSPWLSYHATCFPDMHDAITALVGWAETRGGTA